MIDFNSAMWTQIGQVRREEIYGHEYSALVRPPVPMNAKFVAFVNLRQNDHLRLDEVQIYQQQGEGLQIKNKAINGSFLISNYLHLWPISLMT